MLKSIPGVVHPQLLFALASMGHGDDLVIADANFPAATATRDSRRLIRTSGISATDLGAAILKLFPLDAYVEAPLGLMAPARPEDEGAPALEDLTAMLKREAPGITVASIDRFEFYERARKAFAVVATSDARPYANIIMTMGVIPGSADGR